MISSDCISEAVLRDLYERQELSVAEIAQRLNYPASSLHTLMKGWGIPARSRSEAMKLKRAKDPDRLVNVPAIELERLYRVERLSVPEIAERYHCSRSTVQNRLRQYGILRFPAGRERVDVSKETLEKLYLGQKLSMRAVAQQLDCDHATIRNKLEEYGLRQRPYAESNKIYPCHDFAGDVVEKAYLIGFRLGDLYVSMMGKAGRTIVVECATTKQEQLNLISSLFGPYGHVYIGKPKRRGDVGIACYLNLSFAFLLPKVDAIPDWVQTDSRTSTSFAAGYIDAEGSFYISQQVAHFTVSSYDGNIINWLHHWMMNLGIQCPQPRIVGRQGERRPSGAIFRKNLWAMSVARKESLWRLIEILEPHLKHAKRRRDMLATRDNIATRNARRTSK